MLDLAMHFSKQHFPCVCGKHPLPRWLAPIELPCRAKFADLSHPCYQSRLIPRHHCGDTNS